METLHRKIAQKLLTLESSDSYKEDFSIEGDAETAKRIRRFIKECPHKFVIGCVMDKQMEYTKAWKIPDSIEEHLGGFELEMLLDREDKIRRLFKKENLHRHPTKAADEMMDALKRIKNVYDGDASRIWCLPQPAERIRRNFAGFKGVGQKISNMAVKILEQQPDMRLAGKDLIDISVDVHVRRVFGRTGLVEGSSSAPGYDQRIIDKAYELNPDYPAALDTPVWHVGRKYCRAKKPLCNACPLDSLCVKKGAGA